MDLRIDGMARGTRLLVDETAESRRGVISGLSMLASVFGYREIVLPSIELVSTYTDKAGPEILEQMYTLEDSGDRELCLRPEGTATCQVLASTYWKSKRDVKLWYETKCWRYERPQAGRYREFTQFGVEILNPRQPVREELVSLAISMVKLFTKDYELNSSVKRGLSYYIEDGFEISCPKLGAQKQVCGGGSYKEGCGFAFGVDRLMMLA